MTDMVITILIAQVFLFLVVFFVIRQFMKRNVTGAVDHLQKANEELLKQQGAMKNKIAESEREFKQRLAKVNQEIADRQSQVRKEANQTIESSREQAMQERERLINEAVETRERMKKEVMAEMEEKAIQHAQALISEFFSGDLRKMMHQSLVKDVLDGIKEVDLSQFQIQTDTVDILSAQDLSADEKKEIKYHLETKMSKALQINIKTDQDLVGGVIIKFGTFVIDGSLRNHLQEAGSRIKRETAKRYQKTL